MHPECTSRLFGLDGRCRSGLGIPYCFLAQQIFRKGTECVCVCRQNGTRSPFGICIPFEYIDQETPSQRNSNNSNNNKKLNSTTEDKA